MKKREKEFFALTLEDEARVLKSLELQYGRALDDINKKIMMLQSDTMTQSKAYQLQYQKALKKQLEAVLDKLHGDQYTTLTEYLEKCYTHGFTGTMYTLHGENMPVIAPIDQAAAVKAILTDSELSEPLYNTLGIDVQKLKRSIRQEITRGISTGLTYDQMARNINSMTAAPLARAKTIARTEGHRIMQASSDDARQAAIDQGCDVVKQWDSTLDMDTRESHRRLDGQIREQDEPFEIDGHKAMYPGGFGIASEDCNCRCVALTRARRALDAGELATMKERAKVWGLDKAASFAEFERKYMKATKD